MRKFILLASFLVVSAPVIANDAITYTCTMNNAERTIEVAYAATEKPTPCTVSYTKEGATQTLWSYANTEGQCEAKAAEFAEKQSGWGWNCTNGSDAPAITGAQ